MSLTNEEIDMLMDAAESQAMYFEDNGYRYARFSVLKEDIEYGKQQMGESKKLRLLVKKLKGMKKK